MPRLAPQTVFTAVADSAANAQAAKNASLPLPGRTGVRESKSFCPVSVFTYKWDKVTGTGCSVKTA